jgi:hypothetical protein
MIIHDFDILGVPYHPPKTDAPGFFSSMNSTPASSKYPSEHSDRLRPHAKPVSYRFLGVFTA